MKVQYQAQTASGSNLDQTPKRPGPFRQRGRIRIRPLNLTKDEMEKAMLGVVRTHDGGQNKADFSHLNKNATIVQIHGYPFVWALEKIITQAPRLKYIRIIPAMAKFISENHAELCRSQGVRLVTGYYKPGHVWKKTRPKPAHYLTQRDFFLRLEGEKKALFEELLSLGLEAALVAERYFCLNGEKFLFQAQLAKEFCRDKTPRLISEEINAVIHYLDETVKTGKSSRVMAGVIKREVIRQREILARKKSRRDLDDLAKTIGLKKVPDELPASRLRLFQELIRARQDGRLDQLKQVRPVTYEMLCLRYGLDDGIYRTLKQVGQNPKFNLSRESIRINETLALNILGIDQDA